MELCSHILKSYSKFILFLQGSWWTFQATRMNGEIGGMVIKPDQMQIINPLFILIMVPLFENLIYPCLDKCGGFTPLKRIGCGLVLAGLSFVVSGIVELQLEVNVLLTQLRSKKVIALVK